MKKFLILTCLASVCQFAFSQNILTTANGNYAENFDGMGATGTNYPPNWTGIRFAGTGTVNATLVPVVGDGSGNAGGTYNTGTTGSGERALGTLASGSTIPAFGTSFQNNTGSTILDFSFSGVMEQWRSGDNAAIERVVFEYSTNATGLSSGSWTPLPTMDLVEKLTATTTAAAVNGNLAANQTSISGTATAVNLGAGSTIWVRWRDANDAGSDGLYAIDNFGLNYTNGGADVTPPVIASLSPADNATEIPVNQIFSISFSENVKKGIGNIYLKKSTDGSMVQTLDVTTTGVTIANNVVSFSFSSLALSTGYYIEVDNGALQDIAGNSFAGITGSTAWNFTTTSTFLSYNFNTCVSYAPVPNSFTQQNVIGDSLWKCTAFGNNGSGGVQMNGYNNVTLSNEANEDWLISPALDLSSTTIPLLRFYSINRFAGPQLRLMVSTNYTPGNAPSTAVWIELNGKFPGENTNVWTLSDSISLAGYIQANVYLAWVYTSTNLAAARWTLDDVSIFNSTVAPSPNITLSPATASFNYAAFGSSSFWKAFTFSASNFTSSVTLTAPAGFQLSRDTAAAPATSVVFTQAEANTGGAKTFYARFTPDAADKNYSAGITATSSGYAKTILTVSSTSLSNTKTLEIVNWNMEWFGSPDPTLGPTDKNLQFTNALKVLRYLDADIYSLVEVVDTSRFRRLADSLGTDYGSIVCNYGTRAIDPTNPAYSQNIATDQKQGFIYKKSIFSNLTARPFLKTNNNDTLNPSSYYWWSSGRFPYIMETDANIDGQTKHLTFVLIHAKANTGTDAEKIESYSRRKNGYLNMKDSLDLNYSTANVIILGDLNDGAKRTIAPIATGPDTASSFIAIVADSTDANSYKTVTLPFAGTGSTAGGNEDIDNVIISNELVPYYINGSAQIRSDVTSLVTSYSTTTTDHYPIYSRFYFNQIILPVNLISFTGSRRNEVSQLQWQVTKEVNTEKYVVERSSDGRRFSPIGMVMATATGAAIYSYSFTDNKPLAGTNFYRLKMMDRDGKTTYSGIVKTEFGTGWQVTVSPNPAKNVLYLQSSQAGNITVSLYDATGKKVKQFMALSFVAGEVKQLPLTGIVKGLYTVESQTGNSRFVSKLIVE